jgi:AraC-like DNA-binding protein
LLAAAIYLLSRANLGRLNMGDQAQSASTAEGFRSVGNIPLASQPDAAGTATRLAAEHLRRARIPLQPLLKRAGLSESQIDTPDVRIGVASQIAFLELAAAALHQPLLGFKMARDFDPRRAGLLFYVAASSETLGEALERVQRYSSIVNAGVVLDCATAGDLRISVSYAGVTRHSDRQQMEFLVTIVIGMCRMLTNRRLTPTAVRFAHQRLSDPSEFERFVGCQIAFGEGADEIVFDRSARQLHVAGADPYLNEMLVRFCEEALVHRRRDASSLRIAIENAITPLLPHGRARIDIVARKLGLSRRTLARRLAADGLSFSEVLDQLRSDLAARYLGAGDLTIAQIAWLLGYRGVSAFTHACKRWTGTTPGQIRGVSR